MIGATGLVLLAACSGTEDSELDITAPPPATAVRLPPAGNQPYAREVRDLASADFEVRTRAARALVAAGDEALPALGRAGDLEVPVAGGVQVSATRSVVHAILGRAPAERVEQNLGSPWPNVRRAAADEVGRRDHWSAIPRLIERLDDAAPDVRAASAESLRRLTNQFFGYRAEASLGPRRTAADRWRTWWTHEGRAHLRERELGASLPRTR